MSLVTITLGNKSFQLAVSDESKGELDSLTSKLNDTLMQIRKANPSASFDLLMVILALSLQEQVQDLSHRIAKVDSGPIAHEEEKFAETLSTIAGYLENLARKIGK